MKIKAYNIPREVIGFHSCDKEVGTRVVSGVDDLKPSNNPWDWLGSGVYYWEHNPGRSLDYAVESSQNKQFNKIPIKTPFVLGAFIQLGNCLNLTEKESLEILKLGYEQLKEFCQKFNIEMPKNSKNNRALDCAVIEMLHRTKKLNGLPPYDSIRCAFPEGDDLYEGSGISSRLHIQLCLRNPECIIGYFVPRPSQLYNPAICLQ